MIWRNKIAVLAAMLLFNLSVSKAEEPILTKEFCSQLLEESADVYHTPAEDIIYETPEGVNVGEAIEPTLHFDLPVTIDLAERLDLEVTAPLEAEATVGTLRYEDGELYFNGKRLGGTNNKLVKLCDDIIWNRETGQEDTAKDHATE